jgi:hypothetical protein
MGHPEAGFDAPVSFSDSQLRQLGVVTFWYLLRGASWVHRRVESVVFHDESTIRRRVSVDFTLPRGIPAIPGLGQPVHYVPLTLLRKRTLVSFDLRDESGATLPMLTAAQNGAIAAAALIAIAEEVNGDTLPDAVATQLRAVATGSETSGTQAFYSLLEGGGPNAAARLRIMEEPRLLALAQDLATNFIVIAPLGDSAGKRRIIKFSYDEPVAAHGLTSAIAIQAPWQATRYVFRTPSAGDALSYHFEVEAPGDLEISTAGLRVRAPDGTEFADDDQGSLKRSHLYVSGAPYGAAGLAWVDLVPRRPGLLRAGLLTAIFTAALLTAGRFRVHQIGEHRDAAMALALAIPGLVAAYIARPGEHRIATGLLFGLRLLILIAGLTAVLVAAALVAGYTGAHLRTIWTTLMAIAWICVAAIAAIVLLPHRAP